MLNLFTILSYWALVALWTVILVLYLKYRRASRAADALIAVLLGILAIDAFRTLVESSYFGLLWSSSFGFLPPQVATLLSNPGLMLVPKAINLAAALAILVILFRRWLPAELAARAGTSRALRESEERFRDFAEASADWLWETDEEHRYTWFSDRVTQVTGVPKEWHYGKSRVELGVPGLTPDAWERHRADLDAHRPYRDFEFCRRGPDGERWIRSNGVPVFDGAGRFRGYRGTGTDITAMKQAEARAERAQRQLSDALNAMSEGFALFDRDGRLALCNERFREIYQGVGAPIREGISFEEICRYVARHLLPEELDGAARQRWAEQRIDHFHNPWGSLEVRFHDGRWYRASDYRTPDGGTAVIRTDITELKRREAELREARDHAEQASRAKSEFLTNMSHELRTPLNAIIGFSEVISQASFGPVDPRYRAYAKDINDSGLHLLDIINGLLDIAKIEAGRFELNPIEIDLATTAQGALTLLRRQAEQEGLTLQLDLPEAMPRLNADVRSVKQVLINLLSNAVKFTPAGGTITLRAAEADGGVELCVEDTGVGIAPEHLERITEPFAQVDNSLSRRHDGTGIGLTVTKSLVELHGGHFRIESEVGVGTRAIAWFPPRAVRRGGDGLAAAG